MYLTCCTLEDFSRDHGTSVACRFFVFLSAFLKHAFREVTSGFCKGTVPGAPPRPSRGSPKNAQNEFKRDVLGTTQGAPLGENM